MNNKNFTNYAHAKNLNNSKVSECFSWHVKVYFSADCLLAIQLHCTSIDKQQPKHTQKGAKNLIDTWTKTNIHVEELLRVCVRAYHCG